MRFLLIAAGALAAASSTVDQPPTRERPALRAMPVEIAGSTRNCRRSDLHHAKIGVQRGPGPSPEKLGELPPADLELAVLREVDGCPEPVIASQNFGMTLQNDGKAPGANRR